MNAAFGFTQMNSHELEHLGEPDLKVAGLHIWVHGRTCPEAMDYWDGNWLRATAYCVYEDSAVRVHGSFIHLGEIVGFLRGCQRLYESLEGRAVMKCIEPNLAIELVAERGGHVGVTIAITPDHMTEQHNFRDAFDQTYLPPIIAGCRAILGRFPVREEERLPA